MKVKNLSLTNYRGFERLDIEFHPQVNVIAGINGVGKSSILHALRILLSRGLPELTGVRIDPVDFLDTDVFHEREGGTVSCIVNFENQDYLLDTQLRDSGFEKFFSDRLIQIANELYNINDKISDGDYDDRRYLENRIKILKKDKQNFEKQMKSERIFWSFNRVGFEAKTTPRKRLRLNLDRKINPLAIYFSPNRQLPKETGESKIEKAFDQKAAYSNALDERPVRLEHFKTWFQAQEYLAETEKYGFIARTLARIREAARIFAGISDLRFDDQEINELKVLKDEIWLSVRQLSDGERASLALIFDIARRLSVANPQLEDPVGDASAIIMIDEVELHLHPVWQRKIMDNLVSTFPNCQFIVTSHSPQVIGEVASQSVRFLEKDGDQVMCWIPDQTVGLDANLILDLMGADSINEKFRLDIREAGKLVQANNLAAAREKLEQIRLEINPTHPEQVSNPEIVRLEASIRFLEVPVDTD